MQRRRENLTLRGLGLLDGARKPARHSRKIVVAIPPKRDSGGCTTTISRAVVRPTFLSLGGGSDLDWSTAGIGLRFDV
jgi:hypothetical protein